jgi:hypothetical protein
LNNAIRSGQCLDGKLVGVPVIGTVLLLSSFSAGQFLGKLTMALNSLLRGFVAETTARRTLDHG